MNNTQKRIINAVNYSLKANEYFGLNGCCKAVCLNLIRAGYNASVYTGSISQLLYEILIDIGGRFVIDNNPDNTELFVDPTDTTEILKRIQPGDLIGWRGPDYRSFQNYSHIGFIHNTRYQNDYYVAQVQSGIFTTNYRKVFTDLSIENKTYKAFMNRENPFVYRLPDYLLTWDSESAKKMKLAEKNKKPYYMFFNLSSINEDKLLEEFIYKYDYIDE